MLGWMILFAILSLAAGVTNVVGPTTMHTSMAATGGVFALLLLTSLLTRLVRGQA